MLLRASLCRWSPIYYIKGFLYWWEIDCSIEYCYIITAVVLSSVSDKSENFTPNNSDDQEERARQKENKQFGTMEVDNDHEKIDNKFHNRNHTV